MTKQHPLSPVGRVEPSSQRWLPRALPFLLQLSPSVVIVNTTSLKPILIGLTFSASSLASCSSFRFASSCAACEGVLTPEFPLVRFFASLASFSSCLIRLIRGSCCRAKSTRPRSRAVSSFFRRALSDLFFFSVYRLSSRLSSRSAYGLEET